MADNRITLALFLVPTVINSTQVSLSASLCYPRPLSLIFYLDILFCLYDFSLL